MGLRRDQIIKVYKLEGGEPCPGSLLPSGQRPRGSQGGRGGAIDHDIGVAV